MKQGSLFGELILFDVFFYAGVSAIVGGEVVDDDLVLLVLLIVDGIEGALDLSVEDVVVGAEDDTHVDLSNILQPILRFDLIKVLFI